MWVIPGESLLRFLKLTFRFCRYTGCVCVGVVLSSVRSFIRSSPNRFFPINISKIILINEFLAVFGRLVKRSAHDLNLSFERFDLN